MAGVSIKNLTRRSHAPREVFSKVAARVLPGWELSLVFVGSTRARNLNRQLRQKDYTPNVLSYVLGEKSGEVIICLEEAGKQSSRYDLSTRDFVLYLFIHGLLHIKGGAHGATMERSERKLLAEFAKSNVRLLPHVTSHRNRNRHRHLSGEDSRRRRVRR